MVGGLGIHGLETDREERSLRVEQIERADLAVAKCFFRRGECRRRTGLDLRDQDEGLPVGRVKRLVGNGKVGAHAHRGGPAQGLALGTSKPRREDVTLVAIEGGNGHCEPGDECRLVNALEESGTSVRAAGDDNPSAQVLTWRGSLSAFAGLIAVSELYVGYDSAGGHLAAALGVPAIDVFAGAVSARMIERWQPWGPQPADVVAVDDQASPADVISQVRERLG